MISKPRSLQKEFIVKYHRAAIAAVLLAVSISTSACAGAPVECAAVEQTSTTAVPVKDAKFPLYWIEITPREGVRVTNVYDANRKSNLGYPPEPGPVKMVFPEGGYTLVGITDGGKSCETQFSVKG